TQLTVEKSDEELVYVSSSDDLRLDGLKTIRCSLVMKEQPKNGASHRQEWLQDIRILSVSTEKK
ncbi:MAG: hypothetical protein NC344_02770, partial [Bacteroidales bacterium]|nr:hypothetical protein [Bacteroidales bacterium]MCM1146754.1 hypothetical protein [Bacteroidales bacterium]MCM1511453.1 hypothetical protein [Clostridium sp.]